MGGGNAFPRHTHHRLSIRRTRRRSVPRITVDPAQSGNAERARTSLDDRTGEPNFRLSRLFRKRSLFSVSPIPAYSIENPERGYHSNSFRNPSGREFESHDSRVATDSYRLSAVRIRLPATDRDGQNWPRICTVGKAIPERTNHIARWAGGSQQCNPRKLSIQKRGDEFFDGCRIHLA